MKKKLTVVLALSAMLSVLTACGGTDAAKYVTLPDYNGMEVQVSYMTVSDEEVQANVNAELDAFVNAYDMYDYTVTDKTVVENGDIVNIDYEGKKDGVAFNGGTAAGAHLEIGSGTFIDGFESGLVGVNVGDTVDLNLTFPAEYHSEELAGQDVVFTVTVNSIDTREKPVYDDAFVASLQLGEGMSTYADMENYVRGYMQASCDEQNAATEETAIWETVYAACEVSTPPQEMIDEEKALLTESTQTYVDYYGTDLETFVSIYMGMDMATYEEYLNAEAEKQAKMNLVYDAIADKEGIKVTDQMMQETAEAEYAMYGYGSAEELLAEIGEDSYKNYVKCSKVLQHLKEVVTIVEADSVSATEEQ